MKKIHSKKVNRFISFVYIGVFVFSLAFIGVVSYQLYNEYQENLRLQLEYNRIQEEINLIKQIDNNIDEEGYYNVFSDGNMVVYGQGEKVIIIIN